MVTTIEDNDINDNDDNDDDDGAKTRYDICGIPPPLISPQFGWKQPIINCTPHPTLLSPQNTKIQTQKVIQIHINSANKIQQNTITNCTFQPTLLVLKIFAPTKILCPINHNSLSSNKKSHKLRRTKNKAGNFQSINNWIPMVWRYLGGSYLYKMVAVFERIREKYWLVCALCSTYS